MLRRFDEAGAIYERFQSDGAPSAELLTNLLALAVMMALFDRTRTGVGRWVHTSLLEAQIFMMDFQAARWLMAKEVAQQAGSRAVCTRLVRDSCRASHLWRKKLVSTTQWSRATSS